MDAVLERKADRSKDGYEWFSDQIQTKFDESLESYGNNLFTTDAEGLFDAFLNALPDREEGALEAAEDGGPRQHYNCNCCRRFINTFGGLVSITETGGIVPVMWTNNAPEFFYQAVANVRAIVMNAKVTGVFLSSKKVLGTPEAGGFNHMHVVQPAAMVSNHLLKSASQRMAEKVQDFQTLQRSLDEYTAATIEQALIILKAETLYRADRFLGVAEWFEKLHTSIGKTSNETRQANKIWLAVASAPNGFCNVRGTMIGTLLTDLQDGLSFDVVKARFEEKMNPAQYQQAQVAPTVSAVEQADRIIKQLGLEDSLQRRYLAIDEIKEFVWTRRTVSAKPATGGVFAGVATKQKTVPQPTTTLPVKPITFRKFIDTVLPTASAIQIKAEQSNRFAALVTAANPDSKNILQWANHNSWYYHGGVDGSMQQLVEAAGGRYKGNEVRGTLAWYNTTDLDLHCEGPYGHIFYHHKEDHHGGWLDVDANGGYAQTSTPVENIRWETAPEGHYRFYIHNYAERHNSRNEYKAEIEVASKIYTFEGVAGGEGSKIELASFQYKRGVQPAIRGTSTVSNGTSWNLEMNQYYNVQCIVKSPNLWPGQPAPHVGDHTFFIVAGCEDTAEGMGRGFFTEQLRPELREIRKTLDAYTAMTPIAAAPGTPACGLGFAKGIDWNVAVRVTTGTVVAEYKIERYD